MIDEGEFRQKIISYVKWGAVCVAIVLFCFFAVEKPYAQATAADVIGKIGNCFFVPGVVLSGIGALSYISYLGGYDSLSYTFSNFALHKIWVQRHPKRYKSLYEYKEAKNKKGRKWLPHAFAVGIVSLGLGVIFTVIYLIMS